MNYCKDCKFFIKRWPWSTPLCGHEKWKDAVNAKPRMWCYRLRDNDRECDDFLQAEPGLIKGSWIAVVRWVARLLGVPL